MLVENCSTVPQVRLVGSLPAVPRRIPRHVGASSTSPAPGAPSVLRTRTPMALSGRPTMPLCALPVHALAMRDTPADGRQAFARRATSATFVQGNHRALRLTSRTSALPHDDLLRFSPLGAHRLLVCCHADAAARLDGRVHASSLTSGPRSCDEGVRRSAPGEPGGDHSPGASNEQAGLEQRRTHDRRHSGWGHQRRGRGGGRGRHAHSVP
jgi:hypothetical protein